jgi:hypothetical protein
MLSFLKKIFGSTPTVAKVPYKVETPEVEEFPLPEVKKVALSKATTAKPKADKKPAVKAKPARKPKGPKPD